MNDELDDETLNDFLLHLEKCKECHDELEINFIVTKGVQILDDQKGDYNIIAAFNRIVRNGKKYIASKKERLKLIYVIDTVAVWTCFFALFIFLRMRFFH